MSLDVDPVRLGRARRRFDPFTLGVISVVIALVVAVVKPWDHVPREWAMDPSPAPRTSTPAPAISADGPPVQLVSTHEPTWSDLEPIVTPHDAWGVRAIMTGARVGLGGPPATAYAERWTPATIARDGALTAFVQRDERSIVVLGVTAPATERAEDVRIWRVQRDGQLEWVDAVPILSGDVSGSFLYLRHGLGGSPFDAWEGGRYRIDVLVGDGIRRLEIELPDRFGSVPPLGDLPSSPTVGVGAAATDPSDVPVGAFATTDGVAVPLDADGYRPFREDEAWRDVTLYDGAHVASVSLPRASGLGVMLEPGAIVGSASIARLSPAGGVFEAPPPIDGATEHPPRSRFVVFPAPDGGAWRPGVYAITISWTDDSGLHDGTWHVELRPDGE
jgi:hypothetical protein